MKTISIIPPTLLQFLTEHKSQVSTILLYFACLPIVWAQIQYICLWQESTYGLVDYMGTWFLLWLSVLAGGTFIMTWNVKVQIVKLWEAWEAKETTTAAATTIQTTTTTTIPNHQIFTQKFLTAMLRSGLVYDAGMNKVPFNKGIKTLSENPNRKFISQEEGYQHKVSDIEGWHIKVGEGIFLPLSSISPEIESQLSQQYAAKMNNVTTPSPTPYSN